MWSQQLELWVAILSDNLFPLRASVNPTIYAYEDLNPQYSGMLKVGFTSVDVKARVAQQYPTLKPGKPPYRIVLEETAMRSDGGSFTDHDVHKVLRRRGVLNPTGEWFTCTAKEVKAAILEVKTGIRSEDDRTLTFGLRPEQQEAVDKTIAYFDSFNKENADKVPHFLWNAKMRFGKTFATYQLAKILGWKRILVLTFKPAVQSAWDEDLKTHVDFAGWQFISRGGLRYENANPRQPIVCFGSFQDFLGKKQ